MITRSTRSSSRATRAAAAVLARFGHLEQIPANWQTWGVNAARPSILSATLEAQRDRALLFRDLATLRANLPLFSTVDQLLWQGPTAAFSEMGRRFDKAARAAKV